MLFMNRSTSAAFRATPLPALWDRDAGYAGSATQGASSDSPPHNRDAFPAVAECQAARASVFALYIARMGAFGVDAARQNTNPRDHLVVRGVPRSDSTVPGGMILSPRIQSKFSRHLMDDIDLLVERISPHLTPFVCSAMRYIRPALP